MPRKWRYAVSFVASSIASYHMPTRIGGAARYNGTPPITAHCGCGWMAEQDNNARCSTGHSSYLGHLEPRTRSTWALRGVSQAEAPCSTRTSLAAVCALLGRMVCAMAGPFAVSASCQPNSASARKWRLNRMLGFERVVLVKHATAAHGPLAIASSRSGISSAVGWYNGQPVK
jgi:hypothetical protein